MAIGALVAFVFLSFARSSPRDNEEVILDFELIDPEMAPAGIKPLVMRGYYIILETKKHLPQYAGDRIDCTNCHFSAGNTVGGESNGISLVGVTKKYPRKLANGTELSLAERINSCFEKSLNGKPLPVDSEPMEAMLAYLKWISSPAEKIESMTWLGLPSMHAVHIPNPKNGEKLYQINCAACHGSDGQGQPRKDDLSYPPLWGAYSFNAKAGMNDISIISSFIYQNMPYNDPGLTVDEALDIASFIIKQERPK
jgi:thiosulfate dehydrogenase